MITMANAIIGIDPGLGGAIAILEPTDNGYKPMVFDTPILKDGTKRKFDITAILEILRPYELAGHVCIEEPAVRPANGCKAAYSTGYGIGLWHMAITALCLPMDRVRSQEWKKELSLIGENKDASRMKAIELFPSTKDQLQRKKDDGRAEALLIAEYLRRSFVTPIQ